MDEKPVPVWQRLAALGVVLGAVAVVAVFHSRIGPDLWPLDSSRVGPNLLASVLTWAVLFILAVLLWPPTRRRMRRFFAREKTELHDKIDLLHVRHDEHAASLRDLHAKLDALAPKPRKPKAK